MKLRLYRFILILLMASSGRGLLFGAESGRQPDWQFPTGGELIGSAASSDRGTVYAVSEDRNLYALTPEGQFLWKCYLRNLPLGELTVGPDGTILAGLSSGELAAVNPSGREIWRAGLGAPLAAGVSVSAEGFIYAASTDGTLTCLDNRGRRRWRRTLPAPVSGRITAVPGWGLLCPLSNQRILALDGNGLQRWIVLLAGVPGQPLALDGGIYAGTRSGTASRMDWDGRLLWSRNLEFPVIGGLFARDGRLFCFTGNPAGRGRLLVLDPETGEPEGAEILLEPGYPALGLYSLFSFSGRGALSVLDRQPALIRNELLDSASTGCLVHSGGLVVLTSRDWKIKGYRFDFVPLPGWNQAGGGDSRRGLSAPPPPSVLPPPGADELILREQMAGPEERGKQIVLNEIRRGLDAGQYTGCEPWIQDLLSRLAGTGILDPVYDGKKVLNDHPRIRSGAAEILGKTGSLASQRILAEVFRHEWDSAARISQAEALGALGCDYDGSVTRTLTTTFLRLQTPQDRQRLAGPYLSCLEQLSVYYGGIPDPAGMDLVRELFRGDYGRDIRRRSMKVLGF